MKRLLLILCLLLLPMALARGQTASGTVQLSSVQTIQNAVVANGNGSIFNCRMYGAVKVSITIAGTATVNFEGRMNSLQTFAARKGIAESDTTNASVTSATASGDYIVYLAGDEEFRARVSGWSSGAVTVKVRGIPSTGRAAPSSGGGAPVGTVTTLGLTANKLPRATGGTSLGDSAVSDDGDTVTVARDNLIVNGLSGLGAGIAVVANTGRIGFSAVASTTVGGLGADNSASSGVPLFAAGVVTITGTSGTGNFVRTTSPTFITGISIGAGSAITSSGAGGAINTAAFVADNTLAHLAGIESFTGAKTFTADSTFSGSAIIISGNISAPTWTTNGVRIKGTPGTLTDTTAATGTTATAYTDVLGGNTIAATNTGVIFTNYFTQYNKDPIAGTNVTLSNKWAFGADSMKIGTSNQLTVSNAGVLNATSPVFVTPTLGVAGATSFSTDVSPQSTTQNLGSATLPWNSAFIGNTTQYESVTQTAGVVTHAVLGSATDIGISFTRKGAGLFQFVGGAAQAKMYASGGGTFIFGTNDANAIQFQTNTTGRVNITSSAFQDAHGSTGEFQILLQTTTGPIYSYTTDTTSGFGRAASNAPAIYASNTEAIRFGTTGVSKYATVTTAGWGVPAVYGFGRTTAQTAANSSIATYTVGAADGSFIISANVNVTTSTTHSFSIEVAYTDETNTARVVTFNVQQLGGTLVTSITNITGAGPYEGVPLHIRAKASTSITIRTNAGGTYTTVTYNAEGSIVQIA